MITPDEDVLTSPSLASALPPHLLKRLERRNGATPTKMNAAPPTASEKEKENEIECRSPARAPVKEVAKEAVKESPRKEAQTPTKRRSVNQSAGAASPSKCVLEVQARE